MNQSGICPKDKIHSMQMDSVRRNTMKNKTDAPAPEPLIVAKECAERGCCAHDPRIDGAGVLFHPAAPAPEPVAWLLHMPDGAKMATTVWEAAERAYEYGDSLVEPLYTHPAPVAAPAPAVEAIMAKLYWLSTGDQDSVREVIRAAVEQVCRERDEQRQAMLAVQAQQAAAIRKHLERAERAKRVAALLEDLVWKFAGIDAADSVIEAAIICAKEGK